MATDVESREGGPASDAAEFVEGFAEAWGKSDVEMLVALLADDVVLRRPGLPDAAGKAAARETFTKLFRRVPGLHATVHRWAANGDARLHRVHARRDVRRPRVELAGGRPLHPARRAARRERVNYFDAAPVHDRDPEAPARLGRMLAGSGRLAAAVRCQADHVDATRAAPAAVRSRRWGSCSCRAQFMDGVPAALRRHRHLRHPVRPAVRDGVRPRSA